MILMQMFFIITWRAVTFVTLLIITLIVGGEK